MFDNVVGRGNVPKTGPVATALVVLGVIAFQLAILALAIILSTTTAPTEEEEDATEVTFFAAPPPPPPPPPPPAPPPGSLLPRTEKKIEKATPLKKPDTVVQPKDETPVPEEPTPEPVPEQPPQESVEAGAPGGQVGGVAGGTQGGTVGGVIGGQVGGTPGGDVMSFGEGMTRPTRITGRDPTYTREALEAQVQGTMIVKCTINLSGALENCRIIKPLPHMEKAVLEALQTHRYTPVMFKGRPVKVDYVFTIKLVMPNR